MWPSTHLAIGYLLYTGYAHGRLRRSPNEFAAVLVLIGTQLPDFIDKPLALVGVLESGRSLGHSLLFALPLVALVGVVVYRRTGDVAAAVAFGVSYLSSIFLDGAQQFLQGTVATDIREVSFWVWPLTPPADRIVAQLRAVPALDHVVVHKASWTAANLPAGSELKMYIRLFEVCATVVAVGVWVYDGAPGRATARAIAATVHGIIDSERRK